MKRFDRKKAHHWTHHLHHFGEVALAVAVSIGHHAFEVWTISSLGVVAAALICFDCIERD